MNEYPSVAWSADETVKLICISHLSNTLLRVAKGWKDGWKMDGKMDAKAIRRAEDVKRNY